jgi:hypothetical protein
VLNDQTILSGYMCVWGASMNSLAKKGEILCVYFSATSEQHIKSGVWPFSAFNAIHYISYIYKDLKCVTSDIYKDLPGGT